MHKYACTYLLQLHTCYPTDAQYFTHVCLMLAAFAHLARQTLNESLQLDKETVNAIDDFYTNVRPVATQEYQLALLLADNSFSVLIDLIVAKLSHTNICGS